MNRIARAVLASSLFVSSVSLAQDVQMNVHVDGMDDDATSSAKVNIQGTDGSEQGVNMNVHMNMTGGTRMKVKTTTTHTETTRVETTGGEDSSAQVEAQRAPAPSSSPSVGFRNCGTGIQDSGCTTQRDGQYAMDAETFRGVMKSLKSTANEITRQEMAEKMFKRNYLTAVQFGQVLDLFNNEITRLEVAKTAAPHVVDPQHALGFSSKWNNSISGSEYVDLMSAQ